MAHRTDENLLFVSAQAYEYNKRQEKEFMSALRDMDKQTVVTEVSDPHCLLMAPNGEIRIDGVPHRFTRQALASICSILCVGMFDSLTDVAGIARPDRAYAKGNGQKRNFFSLRMAINHFNDILKLRFDAVSPLRVVRNTQKQIVDGLVRASYQWVSHIELWDLVKGMVAEKGYEFSYGKVAGRHAFFRLLHPYPIWKSQDGKESIRKGIQVIHSEHASSAVRIGRCFVRAPRMVGCWNPGTSGVKHSGNSVLPKAAAALQAALVSEKWELDIEKQIKELRKQVVDPCTTEDFPDKGLRSFGRELGSIQFSKEVWDRARKHRAIVDSVATPFAAAPMTAYDLWCALGELSQKMPILRQDALERVAHGYLSGKLSFVTEQPNEPEKAADRGRTSERDERRVAEGAARHPRRAGGTQR